MVLEMPDLLLTMLSITTSYIVCVLFALHSDADERVFALAELHYA